MRAGSWLISPQLRYTRWAREGALDLVQSKPNRVELLVGFSRGAASNWRPLGSRVALGVIAGATVTDDFRTRTFTSTNIIDGTTVTSVQSSGPKSLILGPSVELQVGKGVSVEVNAIYRPIRSESRIESSAYPGIGAGKRVTWEFPILARYTVPFSKLALFFELGPSLRTPQEIYGASLSTYGVTTGVGVEARAGRLKISPALRYSRWAADSPRGGSHTLQNQLALVAGFSF